MRSPITDKTRLRVEAGKPSIILTAVALLVAALTISSEAMAEPEILVPGVSVTVGGGRHSPDTGANSHPPGKQGSRQSDVKSGAVSGSGKDVRDAVKRTQQSGGYTASPEAGAATGATGFVAPPNEVRLGTQAKTEALPRPEPRDPGNRQGLRAEIGRMVKNKAVDHKNLSRLTGEIERWKDHQSAASLAWLLREAGHHDEAARLFGLSIGWHSDSKSAEGYILSLLSLGKNDEARRFAEPWIAKSRQIARLMDGPSGDNPLSAASKAHDAGNAGECLANLEALAAGDASSRASPAKLRSPETGKAPDRVDFLMLRGWCLWDLKRTTEAGLEFQAALAAHPGPDTKSSEAGYGLALSVAASGDTGKAVDIARQHKVSADRLDRWIADDLYRRASRAHADGQEIQALRLIETMKGVSRPDYRVLALEGWIFLSLNMNDKAQARFHDLDRMMATPESAAGLKVATQRLNKD